MWRRGTESFADSPLEGTGFELLVPGGDGLRWVSLQFAVASRMESAERTAYLTGRKFSLALFRHDSPLERAGFEPSVPGESGFDFAREVRGRLFAGGRRIRTLGPPCDARMGHRRGLPVFLHPGEVKFVPDSARTAVACPSISLGSCSTKPTGRVRGFASTYSEGSPIRGLLSGSGRLVGICTALGFGKPSKFRTNLTSNIFYVHGRLLLEAFVLVRVGFPPTQPSL
jgi:hypothetical protein